VFLGAATLTYATGSGYVTYGVTINPLPSPITGPSILCLGSTITLTSVTPGGTWSSTAPAIATIGATSGVAVGLVLGTTSMSYTLTTGCAVATPVTVTATPAPITGAGVVCIGSTFTPSSTPTGGTWSSSTPSVVAIGSISSMLSGVSAGTSTITYTLPTGCLITTVVTVDPGPTAFTVGGGGSDCFGGAGVNVTLSGSQVSDDYQLYAGGVPAGPPSSGTGVGMNFGPLGTAGTYTIVASDPTTGCITSMTGTATVTILPVPTTVDTVTGGGTICAGSAAPYITLSSSDPSVSYQLLNSGVPSGSPIVGTGTSLSFGPVSTAGTYTIEANSGLSCALMMSGSVIVSINPLPVVYTVTGGQLLRRCCRLARWHNIFRRWSGLSTL